MESSEAGAIHLSILREGDALVVALTDFCSLGRLGRSTVDDRRLAALAARGAELQRGADAHPADDPIAFGAAVFALLPAAVGDMLRASVAPRTLVLQLDPALAGIAWECAHDGAAWLGERFRVARRLATNAPAPADAEAAAREPALQVLIVDVDAQAADALLARLTGLDGVRAARAAPRDVGAALDLGHADPVLVCHAASAAPDEVLAVVLAARRELNGGIAIGEAVRRARCQRRTQGPRAAAALLGIALYGDGERVLGLRAEPLADSLRQVTMLSYDLVGSTRLMAGLGAERYSELLATYHQRCAAIVAAHGGVSDDPQGDDGIMCYFGFPVAREGAARQAVRAALAIAEATDALGLRVRLGVATGEVAVKSGQPVGVAVHLAARLQALAEPGSVVVNETARRLALDAFAFELIDSTPRLKGIERPGAVHRVLAALPAPDELFEDGPRLTPFVGRDAELRRLNAPWARAAAGQAQCVLLAGDAGIGKSRLVREFRRGLGGDAPLQAIECRCTADQSHTAFHAAADFLRRYFRLGDGDAADVKLGKIRDGLAAADFGDSAAALLARLLGVPVELPPGLSGDALRAATLDLLVAWVRRALRSRPLLLVVEDVQWIDPSTRALFERLLAESSQLPLMLLLTRRSDAQAGWPAEGAAERIDLERLPADAARTLVMAACGAAQLPAELVRALAVRADGVPLFLEESARMAVEQGGAPAGSEAAAAEAPRFAVPATIHDLLMARLDRLGGAKQIAQLGAALGREFSAALLHATLAHAGSPIRAHDADGQLALLTASGLLLRKGEGTQAAYYFKHALVRDAAYQSLWERDRKRLHQAVAQVLEEQFGDLAQGQPELLAFHYAEAGLRAEALRCWERAARRAAAVSAHDEAISHARSALALVPALAEGAERERCELRLQLLLAGRLIATDGYGAEPVERAHARAAALCESLGDDAQLLKLELGREGFHFMRADFEQAHAHASRAALMASRIADPMPGLHCRWAVAHILFHQGQLPSAVELMDACLRDYDRLQHRPGAVQDPGVMCLCYSAWGQWEIGQADDALARAERVVALATRLEHKFSLGEAWGFRTTVHHFRGETEAALAGARRAIAICEDGGFAVWLAHAKLMHGRLLAERGQVAVGLDEMRRAYEAWAATGAVVTRPFYLALQAEGDALAGAPEAGLQRLDEARALIDRHGERYYEPEVLRLRGTLLLQAAAAARLDRRTEAEQCLSEALHAAQSLGLHGLGLRASIGLARLWAEAGRAGEARALLGAARARIVGGAGTRDVREADGLLAAWQAAAPQALPHQ